MSKKIVDILQDYKYKNLPLEPTIKDLSSRLGNHKPSDKETQKAAEVLCDYKFGGNSLDATIAKLEDALDNRLDLSSGLDFGIDLSISPPYQNTQSSQYLPTTRSELDQILSEIQKGGPLNNNSHFKLSTNPTKIKNNTVTFTLEGSKSGLLSQQHGELSFEVPLYNSNCNTLTPSAKAHYVKEISSKLDLIITASNNHTPESARRTYGCLPCVELVNTRYSGRLAITEILS